MSEELFKCFD